MIINTNDLQIDERVFLELQQLFESKGYRQFKMRKFEEYSLYLENKSFLGSDNVLTFNTAGGKLLALKPDVTLSIVKNAKATGTANEKLYYRESVYRYDKALREFKEINQMGLEFIGAVNAAATEEICTLAEQSLESIDKDCVFALSHMGFVTGMLDSVGIEKQDERSRVLSCLRSKNAHDLISFARANGYDDATIEPIVALISGTTEFSKALALASSLVASESMAQAVDELKTIYAAAKENGKVNKMRLDFSILNDIDYYTGVIFQGYVARAPKMILSGGRYDKLLEKFNKNVGAMGFALSLTDLVNYYPKGANE